MQVTAAEVYQHFRTNPISTLVALLLLLLFGLVLRFLYHIDIGMNRTVLIHDEVQHLQIKEAYLTRQLQGSIADLKQWVLDVAQSKTPAEPLALLQSVCHSSSQLAKIQWTAVDSGFTSQWLCDEGYSPVVEADRLLSTAASGVSLDLLGGQQHVLEQQYVQIAMPVVDALGAVRARLQVDVSLAELPDSRTGDHAHGMAQTVLLDTQSLRQTEQSDQGIALGADLLSRIKMADAGQFQNEFGLYIVHPVVIFDGHDTETTIAHWRLLSWIPPQVFEHHWRVFWVHTGYVLLAFVVLIFAMFFYSQRIIREQADLLANLNDQRVFLDSLLNSSSDGMLTVGMEGDIQSCNTRTEVLFGYRSGSLLGRPVERLLPSAYQIVDQDYRSIYQQLSEPGQNYCRRELVGVRSDGETLPVEVSYSQLQISGDERLLLIVREITERKIAEKELDNLRYQYFQQEKMSQIGLLMAGILHEVGNPIAAIQGLLEEVLGDDDAEHHRLLSQAHRNNLEMVQQQANRIRVISQDVSGFASPNQSERGLLSLNAILESTTKLLSYDKRLRGIDLVLDLDPKLPALEGVADQLTQVFMNLLVNATDALIEAARSQPRLVITTRNPAEGLVLVSIQDNGCGIDETAMTHIFDSFYTTKPKGKGTGLGLSICEKLIDEHGGQLELQSTLGIGTEVRIYFEYDA